MTAGLGFEFWFRGIVLALREGTMFVGSFGVIRVRQEHRIYIIADPDP